jgi:predicted dehydrogenase
MKDLRFAILGAGFWSHYQLAGWRELKGARCVAIYNRTRSRAETLAQKFGVPAIYDNPEKLFRHEKLDFVDIITEVDAHAKFTLMAARHKVPIICQKPMARSLREAEQMVAACRKAGVWFAIHENWRWQTPMMELKRLLDAKVIGEPFRARIDMISGADVWANQPLLREVPRFILADLGVHILDVARCFFGEASSVYCRSHRTLAGVKGENVATVIMDMNGGRTTVLVEIAYAKTPLERECFPQTLAFIEGAKGSIELDTDYRFRVTTRRGTHLYRKPPPMYSWANPQYAVAHSSIVPCCADLLRGLQTGKPASTSGEDNLKTFRLVEACYRSAKRNGVIPLHS